MSVSECGMRNMFGVVFVCDESKQIGCGVMYELWNDVRLYVSICAATFENECMIFLTMPSRCFLFE